MIPIFAFNMGMATFTGQNMGAGRLERVKRGLWRTELMGVLCCLTLGIISYAAAKPLVQMFGLSEGHGLEYGMQYVRFISPLFVVFCFYLILAGVIQGSGDVMWSTTASVTSLLVRTALAYALAFGTSVAYRAAWVSIPLGWLWALLILGLRYRSGKWKEKAITHKQQDERPETE